MTCVVCINTPRVKLVDLVIEQGIMRPLEIRWRVTKIQRIRIDNVRWQELVSTEYRLPKKDEEQAEKQQSNYKSFLTLR